MTPDPVMVQKILVTTAAAILATLSGYVVIRIFREIDSLICLARDTIRLLRGQ